MAAIEIPDLTTLDEEVVQQTLDFVAQRVSEYQPTIEAKRGVVRQIVLHLNSILGAAQAQIISDKVEAAGSLLKIAENPDEADQEMVDRLMSNFRVIRRDGTQATGTVTIVLGRLAPVTIPKGMRFEAGGLEYTADEAFAARTSAATVTSETDRLIKPAADDFAFTINVTASAAGTASQIRRGTTLNPLSLIPNFVRAYAEADFTNGLNENTNAELLNKLQLGLSDRSSSNRTTIESMIINEPEFERVPSVSVVGFGDPEQIRYHTVFPIAHGGRIDVYARTQELPQSLTVTKTATLVETTADGGIWQLALGRDDAPGFYEIEKVVLTGIDPASQAGYETTETIRGIDVTDDNTGLTPDIETAEEAAFSPFQSAVIRFLDTDTAVGALTVLESKQDYDIVVKVMPQLRALHNFLADRGNRPAAGDILAKAPVPCFLNINFTVQKKTGEADPDVEAIKTALASYVNGLGFDGRLAASALAHVILKNIAPGQTTGAIDMFGRILRPDGTVAYSRSAEMLLIPSEPERMVSSRTTVFFLDPEQVGVAIESV